MWLQGNIRGKSLLIKAVRKTVYFKLRGKYAKGQSAEDKSVRNSGRGKGGLKKQVRRI